MSENEKLRALLAEARDGYVRHNLDCADVVCDACNFAADIDAALAEPVVDERAEWDKTAERMETLMKGLVKSRDEARAEVERLRYALRRGESTLLLVNEKWTKPAFERGQHLPSIRADLSIIRCALDGALDPLYDPARWRKDEMEQAYQRGAEAMREAAAACVEREVDSLMLRTGLAADIRDLPIPEDK